MEKNSFKTNGTNRMVGLNNLVQTIMNNDYKKNNNIIENFYVGEIIIIYYITILFYNNIIYYITILLYNNIILLFLNASFFLFLLKIFE